MNPVYAFHFPVKRARYFYATTKCINEKRAIETVSLTTKCKSSFRSGQDFVLNGCTLVRVSISTFAFVCVRRFSCIWKTNA